MPSCARCRRRTRVLCVLCERYISSLFGVACAWLGRRLRLGQTNLQGQTCKQGSISIFGPVIQHPKRSRFCAWVWIYSVMCSLNTQSFQAATPNRTPPAAAGLRLRVPERSGAVRQRNCAGHATQFKTPSLHSWYTIVTGCSSYHSSLQQPQLSLPATPFARGSVGASPPCALYQPKRLRNSDIKHVSLHQPRS